MEVTTAKTVDDIEDPWKTRIDTQLPKSVKFMAGLILGIRGDNVHTKLSSQEDM